MTTVTDPFFISILDYDHFW